LTPPIGKVVLACNRSYPYLSYNQTLVKLYHEIYWFYIAEGLPSWYGLASVRCADALALVILVYCGKIGRAIQSGILFVKVFVLSCCFQNDLNTQRSFNIYWVRIYSLSIQSSTIGSGGWLGGVFVGGLGDLQEQH
jgi:hypothetical protein